jgi:dCTP diphosphatase
MNVRRGRVLTSEVRRTATWQTIGRGRRCLGLARVFRADAVWHSHGMDDSGAPTPAAGDLAALTARIREFARERDWEQFHDPKSLILALMGEVGELAELFQWAPAGDAQATFSAGERQVRAGEEMSDVLIYLLRLADVLGVDLNGAARAKLAASERRFPPDLVRGSAPHRD